MLATQRSPMRRSAASSMPAACGARSTLSSEQRRSFRRLGLEHVQAAPARRPEVSACTARLVDQPAARGVDQEGGRLHQRQLAGRSDGASPARAACAARRSRLRAAGRRVPPDRMRRGKGLVGHRIGRQHAHVERAAAARHRLADPAEPDDAHAPPPQPRMEAAAPAPTRDPRACGSSSSARPIASAKA